MDDAPKGWTGKLFEVGVTIAIGAIGWFVTGLTTDIKEGKLEDVRLRAEAAAFREQVARENVRKDEYRVDIQQMMSLLRDIQRDVQKKQDRASDGPVGRGSVGPGVWRDGRDVNR